MKIAIYARVSTSTQDLEAQKKDLVNYLNAVYYGCEIVGIYEEKLSGTLNEADRPEFNKIISLDKSDVDFIAVWEMSRLYRKSLPLLQTIYALHEKGIGLIEKRNNLKSLDDDGRVNPMANIVISVLAQMSEIERENIVERSRRTTIDLLQNDTLAHSSRPAYGYKKVNKQLAIDAKAAAKVKQVFEMASAGYSYSEIAATTGVNKATIHHIVHNEVYIGIGRNKLVEGKKFATPRIISDKLYYTVQRELEKRHKREYKPTATQRPLWKKIVCPKCGSHLTYTSNGKYSCHKCRATTINANTILMVANVALDSIYRESKVAETIERLQGNIHDLTVAINIMNGQLSIAIENKEKQIVMVNALVSVMSANDMKPHINKLNTLNKQINNLTQKIKQTEADRATEIDRLNRYRTTDESGAFAGGVWGDTNAVRKNVDKIDMIKHPQHRNWTIANVHLFGRIVGVAFDAKTKQYNISDNAMAFVNDNVLCLSDAKDDNGNTIGELHNWKEWVCSPQNIAKLDNTATLFVK